MKRRNANIDLMLIVSSVIVVLAFTYDLLTDNIQGETISEKFRATYCVALIIFCVITVTNTFKFVRIFLFISLLLTMVYGLKTIIMLVFVGITEGALPEIFVKLIAYNLLFIIVPIISIIKIKKSSK